MTTNHASNDLSLPRELASLVSNAPAGLLLISGLTGSGRTTTLTTIGHSLKMGDYEVAYINFNGNEDLAGLLEYPFVTDKKGLELATNVVDSTEITLLENMSTKEEIQFALDAAAAGNFVVALEHSESALDAVDRIVDTFHVSEQAKVLETLANVLVGSAHQKFVYPGGKGSLESKRRQLEVELVDDSSVLKKHLESYKDRT